MQQLLHRVVAIFLLAVVSIGAWAQTLDGYYKFRNRQSNQYYLSVSNNNYNNNAATPYLMSSNNKTEDEAIWAVYTYNSSKILVHAIDGKIVVCHDASQGGQKVHLQALESINNNNSLLFTQSTTTYNWTTYYRFKPNQAANNTFLNPYGGSPNDIGLYTNADDYGSQWSRTNVDAPNIPAPTIESNQSNQVTLSCTNPNAKIYYTTNGTNPTSSSTLYTGPFTLTQTSNVKAIAYVGADVFAENRPKSSVTAKTVDVYVDPTGITVSPTDVVVYVGNKQSITTTLSPSDAYTNITYQSSAPSVATVNSVGEISGVAVGTATITIQAKKIDGSSPDNLKKTVSVTVKEKVATPVISFVPTESNEGATAKATITCATSGASISYSINGGTWTAYPTGGFTVNNQDVVKAKATVDNASWDDSEIATLTYSQQKVPTPTINVRGNEVTFSCEEPEVTYYYTTNGSTPSATNGTRWEGNTITSSANKTIKVIATKSGYSPSEVASTTLGTAHVVYLRLAGAQGKGDGSSAANAVGSWADAFAKLGYGPNAKYLREQWAAHGSDANTRNLANHAVFSGATYTSTVDNNIIYLVGDVTAGQLSDLMGKTIADASSEYNLMEPIVRSGFFKPVTISGKYANSNNSTTGYSRISLNETKYTLNEDMRFEYVEFYGAAGGSSTDFQMAYYDLEMGEGITCKHFTSTKDFSTYHHGYKQGVTNTAHILFYGGISCDRRFADDPDAAKNFDYYLPHPSGYKITIRSGFFSTISPGGTQWAGGQRSLNGTMGSPTTPVKCTITVDIDRKWNDDHHENVLSKLNNKPDPGNPDCDVAVVIAGVHEGNMYGDVDIIVKSGRIDRVVNGTFGANNFVNNHPADSYFGRANILIDPREPSTAESETYPTKNSLVVIRELYGGGLGRFKSDSDRNNQSSTYFYGKSSVTINGGTFQSAIYASGAGGVNGVGDANHHTPDTKLPYMDNGHIKYGDYAAYSSHNKLELKFHKARNVNEPDFHTDDAAYESSLTIDQTSAKVEIHGGVFGSASSPIEGIFGGGYGFVDLELIDYDNSYWNSRNGAAKPNTRAGAIFAPAGQTASSVTVDGDAEIFGNIYGAGRGDDRYKNAEITFKVNNTTTDDYTQLGQIAGNVELTVGGNAKIHGSVYGAGLGISGFTNMARLYGNTTLTVKEDAVIDGGVYGGGENGIVDQNASGYGNTIVNIIGGTIGSSAKTANVHGGGLGSQTRVVGSVNLTVGEANATSGATIYGDVYGGSAEGKTNGDTSLTSGATTTVTLNAGTINGSLYGGGLGTQSNPADVYGPVQVNVFSGTVNTTSDAGSGAVYGCNNVAGAPQNTVKVDIYKTDSHDVGSDEDDPSDDVYAIDAVYGGGNMASYTYTANGQAYPQVTVHNCDNSIKYVYGGGNAANVPATKVTIWGGNRIGNVFGGGHGDKNANPQKEANVTGNTEVNIYGGTIGKVFAGSNSKGTIGGTNMKLTVNKQSETEGETACGMHIDEVYGGGKEADGKAGAVSVGCTGGEGEGIGTLYGGANNADIGTSANKSNIALNITGGSIGNIFGGNNNGGTIYGTITVNVDWTDKAAPATTSGTSSSCVNTIGNVYGAGNIAAYTGSPKVNILNAITTGSVFGGGKGADAVVTGNPEVVIGDKDDTNESSHHVEIGKSVFGGGDAAAVKGESKVTLNVCGTLINEDVYGGGNAAPVYSTNVTINAGMVRGNVFGGGNGKGDGNPGANVGYDPDNTTKVTDKDTYGTSTVTIYGGTVGTWSKNSANEDVCADETGGVFGGSNSKGDIWKGSNVNIEGGNTSCPIKVKDFYGAGNEAYMNGSAHLNVGCDAPKLDYLFGGAKNADVMGSIELNILNGTFGKVFGGNNAGGKIYGSITVNVDETKCSAIIIDELYGGGYNAPYDVNWGTYDPTTQKGDGTKNADPQVNVISCTSIGQVFGGGYGAGAVITGNTHVNINMVKGVQSASITNNSDKLGTIGTVFGGGNAANVVGDTYVNIGTSEKVNRVSETLEKTDGKILNGSEEPVVGANISGNVYGGGNQADVTGKTHVQVGPTK